MIVVANRDQLREIGAWPDHQPLTCSERAVVPDESSGTQLDDSAAVHRNRRPVIYLTAVSKHEPSIWVEEETATPTNSNPVSDIDSWMNDPPDLRPDSTLQAPQPSVDAVQTHSRSIDLTIADRPCF